nr:MAG TPA: hypothetical protein [Caudoviricetes sp.]
MKLISRSLKRLWRIVLYWMPFVVGNNWYKTALYNLN